MAISDLDDFPIAIIEDRYGGTYSRGAWLAFPEADGVGRWGVYPPWSSGAFDSDVNCYLFWTTVESQAIGRGPTPDAALADLRQRRAT